MEHLMERLERELRAGNVVVEALICEHSGSTPRSAGAGMLVFADGSFAGSVGGGLLEAQVQRKALEMHNAPDTSAELMAFDFSNAQAAKAGMICGGELQVFLQRIDPTPDVLEIYASTATEVRKGRKAVLLHGLESLGQGAMRVATRHILGSDPFQEGVPQELAAAAKEAVRSGGASMFDWQGASWVAAPHLENGSLILVGAGHVAQHTAEAAARVGFAVTVLDDRPEFANRERFPLAQQAIVLDSFEKCFRQTPLDQSSYLVIVTRGHLHDKTVLGQALRSEAAYLGMIGSKRKRDAIYRQLEEEGFSPAEFERVHCPIGLSIGAETPEEIAVSITAELIKIRALRRGTRKHVA